jgi:L-threonylcarbamoyladenylate synthase
MTEIGTDLKKAAELLLQGSLVAIPTETVYGLAGHALREDAVRQIFAVKQRPLYNPLIIHLARKEQLGRYTAELPPIAEKLIDTFWPGPLTLILPKKPSIPDIVTANLPKVAVRIPDHPLTLNLLEQIDAPLAAPSANPFGYISPTTAQHVAEQLSNKIPYILDGGPCHRGLESTIIGFENEQPVLYRLGSITQEDIETIIGMEVQLHMHESRRPRGPGMLPYHYAPTKPIRISTDLQHDIQAFNPATTGIISLHKPLKGVTEAHQVVLSETANLAEAAQQLYAALRQLDKLPIDIILIERMPDQGLGRTMNDRLQRAAAK